MSQYIVHEYQNISPLFDEIERLYYETSESSYRYLVLPEFTDCVRPIIDVFNKYYPEELFKRSNRKYDRLILPEMNKKNLILCFSGGKDSVAAALHYKKNYNVYLYHMQGINKSYADEHLNAQRLAETLGLPIFIDKVSLRGSHRFVEHFMKNMLIANGALNYGITNGISIKIAFGNYYTSVLKDNEFDVSAGDCKDMWQAYEQAIRHILPNFKIYIGLCNIASSYKVLLKQPEFIPDIVSCIGPYRYREYWRSQVEQKFQVVLPPKRCGRCWKCCLEYIYFTDHNVFEYNENYYKYCLQSLLRTKYKESGHSCTNIYELWNSYLFYSINRSKLKGVKNAIIQNGKILYPEG